MQYLQKWIDRWNMVRREPKYRRMAIGLAAVYLYLAGILAQFMRNRVGWTLDALPQFPSLNPFKCLFALFSPHGIQAILGLFCIIVIAVLLFSLYREDRSHLKYDKKRKFYYTTAGTYGTAGWLDDVTLKESFDLTPVEQAGEISEPIYGVKDGMVISRRSDSLMNRHMAVFGSSGSMKSRTFVRNAIISAALKGESLIVTDPKAELVSDTRKYLEDKGYNVKILNLVHPEKSHRFDALYGVIDSPIMVSHIVETVISNTGSAKSDPAFESAIGNLLSALLFYQLEWNKEEYPTLGNAYRLLLQCPTLEHLEQKFSSIPVHYRCAMAFNLFNMASPNLKGNIVTGLGSRLSILQNPEIEELVSYPDMDFIAPGKEKCAYFLVVSDQDTTMKFITALFFNQLFFHLVRYADNECEGKRLPIAVNLLLDEFPNIGFIKDINIKISSVRSRGINLSLVFQAIGQLQNRYPDNMWSELLGNCDTILFLGTTEAETASYISDRTGEVSIAVDTVSKQRNIFLPMEIQPSFRQSEGVGRRMLLTPDEVLRMEHNEMLIIQRGKSVLQANKFDYVRHPESKLFQPEEVAGYTLRQSQEVKEEEPPRQSWRRHEQIQRERKDATPGMGERPSALPVRQQQEESGKEVVERVAASMANMGQPQQHPDQNKQEKTILSSDGKIIKKTDKEVTISERSIGQQQRKKTAAKRPRPQL